MKKFKKEDIYQRTHEALDDICFPLHNYFRYYGFTETFETFEDLLKQSANNKIKIVGGTHYVVMETEEDKLKKLKKSKIYATNQTQDTDTKLMSEKNLDNPEEVPIFVILYHDFLFFCFFSNKLFEIKNRKIF